MILLLLAADAEGRDRARLEALDRDLLLAFLADSEGVVLDPGERLVDLGEEKLLAVAQPEDHRLGVLARGEVDLVREIVRVEARLLGERLPCGQEELPLRVLEHRLEPLQVLLVQAHPRFQSRGLSQKDREVKAPAPPVSSERAAPGSLGRLPRVPIGLAIPYTQEGGARHDAYMAEAKFDRDFVRAAP